MYSKPYFTIHSSHTLTHPPTTYYHFITILLTQPQQHTITPSSVHTTTSIKTFSLLFLIQILSLLHHTSFFPLNQWKIPFVFPQIVDNASNTKDIIKIYIYIEREVHPILRLFTGDKFFSKTFTN